MREIRFRGKNKNTGKWAFGNFEKFERGILCINKYRVIENTIGQYTGLTDCNGTYIYEGDILEIQSQSGECFRGKVVYDENLAAFTIVSFVNPYGVYFEEYSFAKLRVIGNIWDDAELLEEIDDD